MASKPVIIASLLGASIGVPYFTSRASLRDPANTASAPLSAAAEASIAQPASAAAASSPPPPLKALPAVTAAADTSPSPRVRSPSVEQALRFDLTKDWVYRSWDRKSSGPTDVGLFAVRVPLVSGLQAASLAGSLTYYFNVHDQVEHISFRGRTGDPSRLIDFLTRVYEFKPAAAPPGEYLYQVTRRGRVQSELRTRPQPVATTTHGAYSVELELARPGTRRFLPPRVPQLNIPPDSSSSAAEAAASAPSNSETASAASSGSYLDKLRYATPQEEGHVLWKRWPN